MSADPSAAAVREALVAEAERIRAEAAERDPWLADLPVAGIGWATVELDRAARELGALVEGWEVANRALQLGATVRRGLPPERPALLLLEPDTEGRLAAALARFGEGVLVVVLGQLDRADVDDTPRLGPSQPGPLGPARLVLGRPDWGPHVLVLAGAVARRGPGDA